MEGNDRIKKFKEIPTSIISDVLGRFQVMSQEIKPVLELKERLIGPAFTVNAMVGCNLGAHIALYKANPGDIIVIDGKGYKDRSVWGGLQSYVAQKRGIQATVIDGSIRDKSDHIDLKYCVCSRGITPAGPHKGWNDELQIPISCGGVVVNPGDLIVIDMDGIVVIPKNKIEETLKKAYLQIKKEKEWKIKIDKGEIFYEILGLDKKIIRGSK